jgi:hypothetical protein
MAGNDASYTSQPGWCTAALQAAVPVCQWFIIDVSMLTCINVLILTCIESEPASCSASYSRGANVFCHVLVQQIQRHCMLKTACVAMGEKVGVFRRRASACEAQCLAEQND